MNIKHITNKAHLFILILLFIIVKISNATTMMVNQDCSLAEAITAANTDQVVGQCPASNGADELIFEQANQIINLLESEFTSYLLF